MVVWLLTLLPFSIFLSAGPQQSQHVWHRRRPHWPLLFCNSWSGSRLGQRHHDAGEPQRMFCCFRKARLSLTNGFILVVEVLFSLKHELFCPLCRCPTLSPISERKQCWSCTRCFWSTRSLFAPLSQGLKRNWRTQTQVYGKTSQRALMGRGVRCHCNLINYSSENVKWRMAYLWHCWGSSANTQDPCC